MPEVAEHGFDIVVAGHGPDSLVLSDRHHIDRHGVLKFPTVTRDKRLFYTLVRVNIDIVVAVHTMYV